MSNEQESAIDWKDKDQVRAFREKCQHADVRGTEPDGLFCWTCGALLQSAEAAQ